MTIQIDQPVSGTTSGPGDCTVVTMHLPCPVCQHRSGNGPCEGCQPAGSGKTCLPCFYRGGIPASQTPIMPGMPGHTGPQ